MIYDNLLLYFIFLFVSGGRGVRIKDIINHARNRACKSRHVTCENLRENSSVRSTVMVTLVMLRKG